MYILKDVLEKISKRLNLDYKEEKFLFQVQKNILKYIPVECRDKCNFRYSKNSKNIALNIMNYRIYLYPRKNKKHLYELIYPKDKIQDLEKLSIEPNITFEFKLFPCSLLELTFDDIKKFTDVEWNRFGQAVKMAYNAPISRNRERNIDINWYIE